MSKERKARLLTVLILALVVGAIVVRKAGVSWSIVNLTQRFDTTPQDVIYGMLDSARVGDVKKYLTSYTGQMQQSLRQTIAESPDFATYLRDSNAALKGIAVMEPQFLSDREARARIEYVYQDRNEVQYFYLEKMPGGWKIARVDTADRVKTLVPYGTPVQ